MTRRIFLALFFLFAVGEPALAQSKATVVILVRHAEKAAEPAADPPLTAAGQARAAALAELLKTSSVTAIIATPLTRSQQTAAPLAAMRNLNIETFALGPTNIHAQAIADAVRKHAGQTVLVVAHSNTLPAILFALGGPSIPELCDSQYSDLFTLIIDGPSTRMIRSSYGAPSPNPATGCPAK